MSTSLERGELDAIKKDQVEKSDLSPRAVIFGVLLGLFGVWSAGIRGEVYGQTTLYQNIMFTSEEPVNLAFIAALCTLFIMCILVPKIFPRFKIGFSRAELITTFAAGLGVHGIGVGFYNVINKIAAFGHNAMGPTAGGAWDATHPFVLPKDMDVIFDLLMGWVDVPWNAWIIPIIFWTILLFIFAMVPICLGVIMRKRWTEHEQLTYPLARAVLHILDVEDDRSGNVKGFLKNKVFWIGALITFGLVFYEWVQLELVPGLPVIHRNFLGRILDDFRKTSPALTWAMSSPDAWRIGSRSWGVTGVLYLAPSHDFLFTWVVFTPVIWFVNYLIYYLYPGIPGNANHFHGRSLVVFALPAYAILMAWRARDEIGKSVQTAFSKKIRNIDLEDEGLTIREAVFGLIIGTILILIAVMYFLQVNLLWTLVFLISFYTFAFSVARFRAEVAFPSAGFMDHRIFHHTAGTFSAQLRQYPEFQADIQSTAGMGLLQNHFRKFGPTLSMIHMLEGCRMADETNLKRRSFLKAYIIGFLLAAVPCAVMFLNGYYDVGTGMPGDWLSNVFNRLQVGRHVTADGTIQGYPPEPGRVTYGVLFAAVVIAFAYLRANFIWWPFHPIGLIMNGTYSIPAHITTPALIVLIEKGAILRYGGGALYIKMTPFFIGLVFGELLAFIARWIGMAVLLAIS